MHANGGPPGCNLLAVATESTSRGPISGPQGHEMEFQPMPNLLLRTIATVLAILTVSPGAEAAQPFSTQAFQAAQAAGRTVLIDVTAPWCPTCRQQKPTIQAVEKEMPSLVVYEVDFDAAKDVLRRFRVQSQSTLIVFKGETEVGRSTGDTDPARIRALVAKGF
jgi:thioredoxin 1